MSGAYVQKSTCIHSVLRKNTSIYSVFSANKEKSDDFILIIQKAGVKNREKITIADKRLDEIRQSMIKGGWKRKILYTPQYKNMES